MWYSWAGLGFGSGCLFPHELWGHGPGYYTWLALVVSYATRDLCINTKWSKEGDKKWI